MVKWTENVIVKSRKYLSIQFVQSAAYFTREAKKRELNGAPPSKPDYLRHQSYVIGAIWMASGFLEAYINELFSDAAEDCREFLNPLEKEVIDLLGRMWKRGIPRTARYPILEKYEVFLDLAHKKAFDRGVAPYQDVQVMIDLRNALMHYEPEWMPDGGTAPLQPTDVHKLEKRLKGKFKINPLTGAGNPFYPDKCLGHGCAKWCVESSMSLVDGFCETLGTKPTFDHVRDTLNTE
jgi:hypothetical protein